MPVCYNNKLIFIHIPKNGGTSVEKSLNIKSIKNLYSLSPTKFSEAVLDTSHYKLNKPEWDNILYRTPQHLTALQLSKTVPHIFNDSDYTKFAIVRNPFDRLVSEWSYIQNHDVTLSKDYKNMSFEDFVYSVFKLPTFIRLLIFDSHLESQKSFVVDENGNCIVDKVFRFEKINECFKWLNFVPSHEMKSNHSSYSSYYNAALEKFVYNIYKDDFDYFGYSSIIQHM